MKLGIVVLFIVNIFVFKAQDTLYVYDTIFVYDTITVYDTISIFKEEKLTRFQNAPILIDSTYLKNNDTLSATNLNNDIIVSETIKKIEAMKKINLIGVLFIAIQNITLAQHDLGFKFGINGFGTQDNVKEVSNPFTPGLKAGVFYIHNFNKRLGLEMGVNYLYNINNKNAETSSLDSSIIEYKNKFNNETEDLIHNFNLTKYHSQIALPLLLNVKFTKVTAVLGFEYRYKTYRKTPVFESFISDVGLKAGAKYQLKEKLNLSLLIYQGLNREGEISVLDNNVPINSKLKSYSVSATLAFKI